MFRKKQNIGGYRFQKLATPDKNWRGYQEKNRIQDIRQQALRRIPWYFVALVILASLIHGGFYLLDQRFSTPRNTHVSLYPPDVEPIDRNGLREILLSGNFNNLTEKDFEIVTATGRYQFYTSIDTDLQNAIIRSLDTRHANRIGIVAIEPDTGRVLAMVSHNADDPNQNACLAADLPAASLFKIITAAAALEAGGFEYQSRMAYNGGKFTLYKRQLTDQENRYTNYSSLKDAFAESINPIFGKLGKNVLGKDLLQDYARSYFFNKAIEFDLPVDRSVLEITDTPYNWAEIASGFNRTTTISPLHAAMISASMVNGGKLMKPSIVDVAAKDHKTVYRNRPEITARVAERAVLESMKTLMSATITHGTARNLFSGYSKNPVLSRLEMGGKTGALNNNARQIRYDWFTGYASDPLGSGRIAIGVIVAHKEYIGKRAATYFRQAVSAYFKNRMNPTQKSQRMDNVSGKNKKSPA